MHEMMTGGSGGSGKAFGIELGAAGFDVSLTARRDQLIADAAAEMQRIDPRPHRHVAFQPAHPALDASSIRAQFVGASR
jgi:NADP-dependent 3-hydroxy acid dehydrogenase YdfG